MAGHLRRRDGIYWFRRRVPKALLGRLQKTEYNRSLGTSSPREAAFRCRKTWLATEEAFKLMAMNPSLPARQAMLVVEQLLQEPIHRSPTADDVARSLVCDFPSQAETLFGQEVVEMIGKLPEDQPLYALHHLLRVLDGALVGVSQQQQERAQRQAGLATAQLAEVTSRADEAEKRLGEADVSRRVADEVRAIVSGLLADTPVQAPTPAIQVPPTVADVEKPLKQIKKKPLFSIVLRELLVEKTRVVAGHRSYDQQTVRQAESTANLWTAIVGDRPINDYDGSDAKTFRNTMLKMPSNHGKAGTRAATRKVVTPLEAVSEADEKQKAIDSRNALLPSGATREADVPRVMMKTLKRHFSALSQVWVHAQRADYVPKDRNPFRGWEYQGVKKGQRKRSEWSNADLNRLLASPWFDPEQAGDDRWWVVVIAMFSGMRVEEIARLRPAHDIVEIEGVWSFKIQKHANGWAPKTEASERVVPVHSKLMDLGLLQKADAQRAAGAAYLLESFRERPSSDKLSAKFVSDFSRHKTSLGIGAGTTFHSFRHTISTLLRNTSLRDARESWIDAVLGHEGGDEDSDERGNRKPRPKRSEGQTTYLGAISVENLQVTVEAIRYPDGVHLSRLGSPHMAV
jgi:integrase